MAHYRIRTLWFLILSFSIALVASAGTLNSYMNKSWADAPPLLDNDDDANADEPPEVSRQRP